MCPLDWSEFPKCHPPSKSLRKHTVVTDSREHSINLCQGHPMHVRGFVFGKGLTCGSGNKRSVHCSHQWLCAEGFGSSHSVLTPNTLHHSHAWPGKRSQMTQWRVFSTGSCYSPWLMLLEHYPPEIKPEMPSLSSLVTVTEFQEAILKSSRTISIYCVILN